jgi:hypothetical protein
MIIWDYMGNAAFMYSCTSLSPLSLASSASLKAAVDWLVNGERVYLDVLYPLYVSKCIFPCTTQYMKIYQK